MALDSFSHNQSGMAVEGPAEYSRSQRLLRKVPGAKYVLNRLHARRHNSQLDDDTRRLENQHMRVLQNAKLHHDNVRGAAEAAQVEHEAREARRARKEQIRNEQRRQKAMEERLRLERIAREDHERQQKEEAELEAQIEARRAQEAADRRALEQRRRQRQEEDEARRKDDAKADQQAKEQEAQKQRFEARQQQATSEQQSTQSAQPTASTKEYVDVHQRYLALHQRLKTMRRELEDAKKQFPGLKQELGNVRRSLRSDFSKFTRDVVSNRNIIARIQTTLKDANSIECPHLDVRQYIVSPIPASVNQADCRVPAIRIFLLSHMAKAVVKQMIQCGSTPEDADTLGLGTVSVLADPAIRWQGIPLSDILLAKLHKTVPVLFGITGRPDTDRGREALGWARENKHEPWSGIQRATEKWTGIGAGFAALSLRSFNNPCIVPFPPRLYWECVARLLNTPAPERTVAHFFLTKALVQYAIPKIVRIFGQIGIALIRRAVNEFPAGSTTEGAKDMALLRTILSRDQGMRL